LHQAARSGAIDASVGTLADACRGSNTVILAAPVRAILRLLPEIASHIEPETLVTDTGGTKREIVRTADAALRSPTPFVGGHPLAGRLTAGVEQASPTLFHGVVYCLTPSPNAAPWAVDAAVNLVERIGAQPHFLSPDEHDSMLAAISHLPYFASAALVNAVAGQSSWNEMGAMAAGGFRAASTLAEADPHMWGDIAATNRDNLVRQIDALIERLATLKGMVASGDDELLRELQKARSAHAAWLASRGEAPTLPPAATPRGARWTARFRR
jgi:prephenate dehydrogenase